MIVYIDEYLYTTKIILTKEFEGNLNIFFAFVCDYN